MGPVATKALVDAFPRTVGALRPMHPPGGILRPSAALKPNNAARRKPLRTDTHWNSQLVCLRPEETSMSLQIRDTWRFEPPDQIHFNADGTVDFGGKVGNVFLPKDYAELMTKLGPVTFEDEDNACMATYEDGRQIVVVEYLSEFSSVVLGTRRLYESMFHDDFLVPPGFIYFASGETQDIVMNVDAKSADFGKVYARPRTQDPLGQGDNTQGLGWIADSFTGFMNDLTEEDNL
ncbi:MAG: hypothetical protein AAF654_07210 [Myxococcota bacterium]